jgi:uncharacterized protein Yka (UPF0111/DUF47 family)
MRALTRQEHRDTIGTKFAGRMNSGDTMATPNPMIAQQLQQTKDKLAQLKAEKARLYPPNAHPFTEPDRYPSNYTPEQIQYRNRLVQQIEELERRIDELQDRLYRK